MTETQLLDIEAKREMRRFHVDTNGVVRWDSNDTVPPTDILAQFLVEGLITQEESLRSISMRKIEDEEAIREYIASRQKYGYSDEEMFEMRAAFGPGEKVVDIFTGEEITL